MYTSYLTFQVFFPEIASKFKAATMIAKGQPNVDDISTIRKWLSLTELTMHNTDLLSVQTLLGMVLFLQGTANPQDTSKL
jgi:hypothetical protein